MQSSSSFVVRFRSIRLGIWGVAIAALMATPALAGAEVIAPHVASPHAVSPHVESPSQAAPAPPEAAPPPEELAEESASAESSLLESSSSEGEESVTSSASSEQPAEKPIADELGCKKMMCETPEQRYKREELERKHAEEAQRQLEIAAGWDWLDHLVGSIMCPTLKGRARYLYGQMQYFADSAPFDSKFGTQGLPQPLIENIHASLEGEYSEAQAGVQRWCLTTRDQ